MLIGYSRDSTAEERGHAEERGQEPISLNYHRIGS